MQTDQFIPADQLCTKYNIEISFIRLLDEFGLTELRTVNETICIPEERLPEIEKMIRLHYELDINLEGIEVINFLLERIENLQTELTSVKNKLSFYEDRRMV